jgi:hypothetical protein
MDLFFFHSAKDWMAVVKMLNTVITQSPIIHGRRVVGFVDALMLLSGAYASLGRFVSAQPQNLCLQFV